MRRRRGTLSKVTVMTRGPSSRSGQALETTQNFSSHSTSPRFASWLRATAPASLSSTISGSGLWNRTGEMHRWKTAEQIAAGILGAQGPWSNGAQATSRPHLRMSLWFRSVETWASLSGHTVGLPMPFYSKFHAMPHLKEPHIRLATAGRSKISATANQHEFSEQTPEMER
jgi:hypothetical protein